MNAIQGQLMPGHFVWLDPVTAGCSGSWVPGSGDPLQAYGQEMIELLYGLLRRKSPVSMMDIGAGTGSFCLLAKFIPDLRVVAIEPVRSIHNLLVKNVELNGLSESVAVLPPIALSDHGGEGIMNIPIEGCYAGLSRLDGTMIDTPHRQEKVDVFTLDAICGQADQLDVIKLDVERSEEDVLRGGEKTIRKFHPLILLEATCPEKTVPLLKSWGYTIRDYSTDFLAL